MVPIFESVKVAWKLRPYAKSTIANRRTRSILSDYGHPDLQGIALRLIFFILLIGGTLLTSSCAVVNVDYLADDALNGRDNNTAGSITAQDHLITLLSGFGAQGLNSTAEGDAAFQQTFPSGTNILALIPGTDLAHEYVMIGAHYDHVTSCSAHAAGATICNGATDNAAGVAAVLEIALKIRDSGLPPRRSVILAFWDREEDGLLGSSHYVSNPLVPLSSTVAYINFDIQGSNLLPSLRGTSFAVGAETGGAGFVNGVQAAIDSQPLETQMVSSIFGQNRSDYINLIGGGVPTVFFSDSTGPCYHTTGDDISVVDFRKLYQQINIASDLTNQLVSGALTPVFTGGNPLATYSDAVSMNNVLQRALTDIGRFSAADQVTIQSSASFLAAMVADGSGSFDDADVFPLLNAAVTLVSLLAKGECDGFLLTL
jgi:hypothetical protein